MTNDPVAPPGAYSHYLVVHADDNWPIVGFTSYTAAETWRQTLNQPDRYKVLSVKIVGAR